MLRKLLIEEEEKIDENTYIYDAEFVYESKDDVEKISPSDPEEEDDEPNPVYDSGPIYDTELEEEFIFDLEEEVEDSSPIYDTNRKKNLLKQPKKKWLKEEVLLVKMQ